jgi:hypothetical protein
MLTPLDDQEARQYLCGLRVAPSEPPEYHGVLFAFRHENSATLPLLWES